MDDELTRLRNEYRALKYREAISSLKRARTDRQIRTAKKRLGDVSSGLRALARTSKSLARSTSNITRQSASIAKRGVKSARSNKKRTGSFWKKSIY